MKLTLRVAAVAIGLVIVVSVAVAGVAANTTSTSNAALKATLTALQSAPQATKKPDTADVHCTRLTASLRPPAELPRPGRMPAGSFMARIQRRGRLIVGVNQNFYLFGYLNPRNLQFEGFEIDIAREIAKAILGDPRLVQWKALSASERIPYVQQGKVDLVVNNVTITCERKQQVAFSTVYYVANQRVLVRSDSHVRSLDDLGGQRVCATAGTAPFEAIAHYPSHPIAYPEPSGPECLVALQEGQVDAISTDDSILLGFEKQDPYTKIVGPSVAAAPYGVAISKQHPEFVRFVNGVLAKMRADGKWSRIHQKWLGSTAKPPPASYGD